MPGLKLMTTIATFASVLAFIGVLFVYGKQIKKRITYLPSGHKGGREFRPYY